MSQGKKHLFLFTIGPVQSFIFQARKTQDLYAGSQLLCELVRKATQELRSKCPNVEFVFPHADVVTKTNASIPNRFLAVIDVDARQLGEHLEEHIRDKYKKLAYKTLESCFLDQSVTGFDKQIDDFLDIHWAAVAYEENKDSYEKKYTQIENLLGATKNTRYFNQLKETGRKSSLSGERNALFYHFNSTDKFRHRYLQGFYKDNVYATEIKNLDVLDWSKVREDKQLISIGEGLCAIDFVKRCWKPDLNKKRVSFPSVADVCVNTVIQNMQTESYINVFMDTIDVKTFESHFYYKENINAKYIQKNYGKNIDEATIKLLRKWHEECIKDKRPKYIIGKHTKYKQIPKYYAALSFDGDKMGKWMSGEYLDGNKLDNLKDFQNLFSKLLGDCAEKAHDIMEGKGENPQDWRGKTVYAGGDDFLGFVSLEHLFKVLRELREAFDTTINAVLQSPENQQKYGITEDFTFSAGIVIAQYKHPLGDVLQWAKKMEKKAKSEQGGNRNAYAIAVLKKSGEINETIYKWKKKGEWTTERFDKIIDLLKEKFSSKFVFEFRDMLERICDVKGEKNNPFENRDMIKTELQRLIKHRSKREQKPANEDVLLLTDAVLALHEKRRLNNFLNALDTCAFIESKI